MTGFDELTYNTLNKGNMRKLNGMLSQLFKNSLHNKPEGEPYVIFKSGQSNSITYSPASTLGATPAVKKGIYDYRASAHDATDYAWRPAEISTNFLAGNWDNKLGLSGNNCEDQAYTFAYLLHVATGRDVYIFSHIDTGASITSWMSGGDADTLIAATIGDALASIPKGPSCVDFLFWMQGETDQITGQEAMWYAQRFGALVHTPNRNSPGNYLGQAKSQGYYDPDRTRVLLVNPHRAYSGWDGLRLCAKLLGARASLINTSDFTDQVDYAWDGYGFHLRGDGGIKIGQRAFMAAMSFAPTISEDHNRYEAAGQASVEGPTGGQPLVLHPMVVPAVVDGDDDFPALTSTTRVMGTLAVSARTSDGAKRWSADVRFAYSVTFDGTPAGINDYDDFLVTNVFSTEDPATNAGITLSVTNGGFVGNKFIMFLVEMTNSETWEFDWYIDARLFN